MTKEELKPIDVSKYRITETGQVLKMNKEELKDEMKNRISLALKDPILQQGFEIICKENAELKKENKTLRIHQTNAVLEGLETEVLKNSHRDRANKLQDQLTNAKEIIRELLLSDTRKGSDWTGYLIDLKERAEQFLKDSEVENDSSCKDKKNR